MNKSKKSAAISRSKILFSFDQSLHQQEELELQLLELRVTGNSVEKLIQDGYDPYLRGRKLFTHALLRSYAKALDELHRLRGRALRIEKELAVRRAMHETRVRRFRRMEEKRKV